jgi:micrococcal nuclease
MSRKKWERLLATLVTAVFLLVLSRVNAAPSVATPDPASTSTHSLPYPLPPVLRGFSTSTNAFVTRAVDGDTLEATLDDGTVAKIRLLGVNTPESVDPRRPVECFGKEASKHMAELVAGKRVLLAPDPQADEVDKYGRLLRNVFLEDGTDVNAALIRDGYAYAYLDFPLNKLRKIELARLQDEAKMAERGLWSPETCNGLK